MKRTGLHILLITAAMTVLLSAPDARSTDQQMCLSCHGLKGFGFLSDGKYRSLYVDQESYHSSRHREIGCLQCHRNIAAVPHESTGERVNCGMECHTLDSVTGKPYSHESIYWGFLASVHGKGSRSTSSCLLCHPTNPPAFDENKTPGEKLAKCSACHADSGITAEFKLDREIVNSYLTGIHGRAVLNGATNAPTCPDCHTQHAVLSSENKDSSTNPGRLAATCSGDHSSTGTSCHLETSSAKLVGMSPLPGISWTDLPGGAFFYYVGLLLAFLFTVRMLLGMVLRR